MKLLTNKKLLISAILITVYFLLLFLNSYIFKFKFVLIDVFQELLTIPMMLWQFVILFLAVRKMIRYKEFYEPQLLCVSLFMVITVSITLGLIFTS